MGSPSVLIALGSNWISAARLPRVFKDAGCAVHALCPSDWALAHTRFIDVRHDAPSSVPVYVDALRAHLAAAPPYDWVVVADDPLFAHLAGLWNQPWARALLPTVAAYDVSALLASKGAFAQAAPGKGVLVPPSVCCRTLESLDAAVALVGLPVMVKKPQSFGGMGVRLARDAGAARAAFDEFAGGGAVVVQPFVSGQIGNTLALFVKGRPIQWISAFKSRTWPGPFGPSTARRVMDHAQVEPLLQAIGRMTSFHGFAAVDWVLEASGTMVVLELNARPAPTVHMAARLGVDFSHGVRQFLKGDDHPLPHPSPGPDARVESMFPEDVFRALGDQDARFLAQWVEDPALRADVPWDDPGLVDYYRQRRKVRALFDRLGEARGEAA